MKRDILITGKRGFIGSRIRGGRAFQGNIADYKDLFKETKGVSGIVHLAAVSGHKACDEDPNVCVRVNLVCLADLLEIALMRGAWVLFVSTFQVREPNLYGLTKLAGEELCRLYQRKGLKVKILRLPIVYGPGDKSHKVVTKIIGEIRAGKIPRINTHRKFQFLYVEDAARVIEKEVEVLSCRKGKKYSLHELVTGIKKCLQKGEGKA